MALILQAEWTVDDSADNINYVAKSVKAACEKTELIQAVLTIIFNYLEHYSSFDEKKWSTLLGRVKPAPLLPFGFSKIWNGPCPIYKNKKVRETHLLIYRPSEINDTSLNLQSLQEVINQYFQKLGQQFKFKGWDNISEEHLSKSFSQSCWMLITKEVLPQSIAWGYPQQTNAINDLVVRSGINYEVPDLLESAICFFVQHLNPNPAINDELLTYRKCHESSENYCVVIGGFLPNNLSIGYHQSPNYNPGIAPVSRLEIADI